MNTAKLLRRGTQTEFVLDYCFYPYLSPPPPPLSLSFSVHTGKYDFEWGMHRFHDSTDIRRRGREGESIYIIYSRIQPAKDWLEAGQLAATQSVISFFLNPPSCLTLATPTNTALLLLPLSFLPFTPRNYPPPPPILVPNSHKRRAL